MSPGVTSTSTVTLRLLRRSTFCSPATHTCMMVVSPHFDSITTIFSSFFPPHVHRTYSSSHTTKRLSPKATFTNSHILQPPSVSREFIRSFLLEYGQHCVPASSDAARVVHSLHEQVPHVPKCKLKRLVQLELRKIQRECITEEVRDTVRKFVTILSKSINEEWRSPRHMTDKIREEHPHLLKSVSRSLLFDCVREAIVSIERDTMTPELRKKISDWIKQKLESSSIGHHTPTQHLCEAFAKEMDTTHLSSRTLYLTIRKELQKHQRRNRTEEQRQVVRECILNSTHSTNVSHLCDELQSQLPMLSRSSLYELIVSERENISKLPQTDPHFSEYRKFINAQVKQIVRDHNPKSPLNIMSICHTLRQQKAMSELTSHQLHNLVNDSVTKHTRHRVTNEDRDRVLSFLEQNIDHGNSLEICDHVMLQMPHLSRTHVREIIRHARSTLERRSG